MTRIFVAGPWGDFNGARPKTILENIRKADEVGKRLVHEGHEVYVPHTMCKSWSGQFPEQDMQRLDKSFLKHWAQAIYRIPGPSAGADAEVVYALQCGLEIWSPIGELGQIVKRRNPWRRLSFWRVLQRRRDPAAFDQRLM